MSVSAKSAFRSFVHDQPIAISPWVVNHNLNRYPQVTVLDDTSNEVIADVSYTTLNQVSINFALPVAGKAIFT